MVQEEISHFLDECNTVRETLRKYRDDINDSQKRLLKVASSRLEKDDLTDLEHYQNQFHIQLINIHDFKHDYKVYQNHVRHEGQYDRQVSDHTRETRTRLMNEFNDLESTLQELQKEFESFVQGHLDSQVVY